MSGLGRVLRVLPRRRPGIAAPASALVLALLFSSITVALWTGDATGSADDRTFMTVLTSSFVALAALLLGWRARRMRQRMVVKICEAGIARETRSRREEWPFAAVRGIEPAPNVAPGSANVLTGGTFPLRLVPIVYDNVDETLLPLLRALWQGQPAPPPAPAPTAATTAQVEFRPASKTRGGARGTPLLGSGQVGFGPEGMLFHGPRARTIIPEAAGALVGVAGVVAAAILLVALDIPLHEEGGTKLAYIVGVVAGLAPGWVVYSLLRKRLRGKPVAFQAPWNAVRVFAVGTDDAELRVMDWDYRGDLRINGRTPADGAALRNALAARLESAPAGGMGDVMAAVLGGGG